MVQKWYCWLSKKAELFIFAPYDKGGVETR